MAADWRKLT